MAPPFLIDSAQIVGLFMETLLYGVYLVTLAQCLRALLWSPADHCFKKVIHWHMLAAAMLMFTFATLDVAFGLRHNLDAFVYYTGPGGAKEEFENISYWVQVTDYVAQTCVGDSILIYRCWMIWNKRWLIVLPSIVLWLAGTTCGAILIHTFATMQTPALTETTSATPWVDGMTALTLAMNLLSTFLIVCRIWSIDRETTALMATSTGANRRVSKLRMVMRILIDSAALYTVCVIVFVATYVAGSNANYGTSDNLVQIIGISFNLIIIRVNSESEAAASAPESRVTHSLRWGGPVRRRDTLFTTYPGRASDIAKENVLEIKVSQDVEMGTGSEV
ncbi:hypothetical protein FB45DRAFT_186973 [Roridomyces roridus]|uniref:Uncharacterized protein n=1 Tax=Roridomyces roridus TaxID=1738132 RepID=A0AAD7CEN4_9AGAR|nr:hypothetical protein FB45DRAFT_186973 [Roridomyces roridus]